MTINAIFARDLNWGIGKDGTLPWPKNKQDMEWFRECTSNGVIVMGRKTWDSLGCKPLPNRINIVVSRDISSIEGNPDARVVGINKLILKQIAEDVFPKNVWVIGGAELYRQTVPHCDFVYMSVINQTYDCDTFFDQSLLDPFIEISSVQKAPDLECNVLIRKEYTR